MMMMMMTSTLMESQTVVMLLNIYFSSNCIIGNDMCVMCDVCGGVDVRRMVRQIYAEVTWETCLQNKSDY